MTETPELQLVDVGGLAICYDRRVLAPRPWTAGQSAWGAELLGRLPRGPVLELCSGAGHIGLLTVCGTDRRLVQVDVDPVACDFAVFNADRLGLADRVEVRCGSMDDAVHPDERFPLVLADPPWVPTGDVGRFPEDPVTAIDGGEEGFDLVRRCVDVAARALTPTGSCLLQVGTSQQAGDVATYLRSQDALHLTLAEAREFERGWVVRIDRA